MSEKLMMLSQLEIMREASQVKACMLQVQFAPTESQAAIHMNLFPYYSNLCIGLDSVIFPINEIEEIVNCDFIKMLKRNRIGMKLLSDKKRLRKKINILSKIIDSNNKVLRMDYGALQKIYIKVFGQKDFGVSFYNGFPIANTFQQTLFWVDFLLDENNNENTFEGYVKHMGEQLKNFSRDVGAYISTVATGFEESFKIDISEYIAKERTSEICIDTKEYYFSDDKRRDIFTSSEDKFIQLMVFVSQCQLNFVDKLLPNFIPVTSEFYLRIKLINYLSVVSILGSVENTLLSSGNFDLIDISEIFKEKNRFFPKDSPLRNNIFHYSISDIDASKIDYTNNIINELIKASSDMEPDLFLSQIDVQIDAINSIFTSFIGEISNV